MKRDSSIDYSTTIITTAWSTSSIVPSLLLLLLLPAANEAFTAKTLSSSSFIRTTSCRRRRQRSGQRLHFSDFILDPSPVDEFCSLDETITTTEPGAIRSPISSSPLTEALILTTTATSPLSFSSFPTASSSSSTPSSTTTTNIIYDYDSTNENDNFEPFHPANLNTFINLSVLTIIVLYVLTQILSVDVGITRGWTTTEIANRLPLDNWQSYASTLEMAPIRTKALTSASVYAIGDVLSQGGLGNIGKLDRGRVLRSLIAGFIGHGPMSHVWYYVSEDFFINTVQLQHVWWDFIPKVILDQAIFGPIWNNSYILLLGIMQLHTPRRILSDMKRTTIPLLLSGLRLWPFVHIITYGVIPIENRLLWVDAVEIIWVTILASTASADTSQSSSSTTEEETKTVLAAAAAAAAATTEL